MYVATACGRAFATSLTKPSVAIDDVADGCPPAADVFAQDALDVESILGRAQVLVLAVSSPW